MSASRTFTSASTTTWPAYGTTTRSTWTAHSITAVWTRSRSSARRMGGKSFTLPTRNAARTVPTSADRVGSALRGSRSSVVILRFVASAFLLLAVALIPRTLSAQDTLRCPEYDVVSGMASPDLYCIELLASGVAPNAAGIAHLLPARSPFGIAVTVDGGHAYDVAFTLRDLPDPSSLGAYTRYVAWATTPQLSPVVKLGEVRNGETTHGQVT